MESDPPNLWLSDVKVIIPGLYPHSWVAMLIPQLPLPAPGLSLGAVQVKKQNAGFTRVKTWLGMKSWPKNCQFDQQNWWFNQQ